MDQPMKVTDNITVRYAETDRMGIVHHSNYPVWYEVARTKLIKEMGISYSKLEELGLILPLLEMHSQFIKACTYEEELYVTARLTKFSIVKLTIEYEVFLKATGELINRGYTTHALVEKNMKPCNTKKKYPEFYKMLEKYCEHE